MDILINSKTTCEHEMEIVIPAAELEPLFEKAYREEAKKIAMPGFRKGKVPIQIIRKRFGQAIEADVLEKITNDHFKQALEERDITPISQPILHDLDYVPGDKVTAKISYETNPEVVLQNHVGFSLERLSHTVTDEEVDDQLREMLKEHRTLEPAEMADEEGYVVTCEILRLDADGQADPKSKPFTNTYDLGDENIHPDFKAELLNIKSGETKDVEFHVDHHHEPDEEVDHDHVERYRIHAVKIERVILPELDDAFATMYSKGAFTDLASFREDLRRRMVDYWAERYQQELEEDLITDLIRNNPIDVPQRFVDEMVEESMKRLAQNQPNKKLPDDIKLDSFRENERMKAQRYLQWDFLAREIARVESIVVTDADLEEKAEHHAARTGLDKDMVLRAFKAGNDSTILFEKIVAWLLERSEITEVNDNDFRHEDMMPFATGQATDAEFTDVDTDSADETNNDDDAR